MSARKRSASWILPLSVSQIAVRYSCSLVASLAIRTAAWLVSSWDRAIRSSWQTFVEINVPGAPLKHLPINMQSSPGFAWHLGHGTLRHFFIGIPIPSQRPGTNAGLWKFNLIHYPAPLAVNRSPLWSSLSYGDGITLLVEAGLARHLHLASDVFGNANVVLQRGERLSSVVLGRFILTVLNL